jgi:hypothetical protein
MNTHFEQIILFLTLKQVIHKNRRSLNAYIQVIWNTFLNVNILYQTIYG